MRAIGKFAGVSYGEYGKLIVSFEIEDKEKCLEELDKIKGLEKLEINATKIKEKKSNRANRYLWKLITEIAHALDTDKYYVYIAQLAKYGAFSDIHVSREALPDIRNKFRYLEILDETAAGFNVRCYWGSSGFTKEEMNVVLSGTVREARDLGIDTITPDEAAAMIETWKGGDPFGY